MTNTDLYWSQWRQDPLTRSYKKGHVCVCVFVCVVLKRYYQRKKIQCLLQRKSARYYGLDSLLTAAYKQDAFAVYFTDSHQILMEQRQTKRIIIEGMNVQELCVPDLCIFIVSSPPQTTRMYKSDTTCRELPAFRGKSKHRNPNPKLSAHQSRASLGR